MALREQIKEHMDDTYTELFEGQITNVVKCENVPFQSERDDVFMSLQLSVSETDTIEDSIRHYVAAERLEGDNQYETDQYGKQDAKKFIKFKKLPPVLQV